MSPTPRTPVREAWRDGSGGCPLCSAPLASPRARYCSRACQQRAYRLRRQTSAAPDLAALRQDLQRRQALVARTIYECPSCAERFVGARRCPACHLVCRALGLGGHCPECDHPTLLADLLATEVPLD